MTIYSIFSLCLLNSKIINAIKEFCVLQLNLDDVCVCALLPAHFGLYGGEARGEEDEGEEHGGPIGGVELARAGPRLPAHCSDPVQLFRCSQSTVHTHPPEKAGRGAVMTKSNTS